MPPVRVECNDATVQRAVEHWLTAAAPDAPTGVHVRIDVVDAPWAGDDTRVALCQPDLRFHYGPPDNSVRIVWRDGAGHAWLAPGALSASVELTRRVACDPSLWHRPFLLPVLLVLLRRVGWHHIHAASARDPDGRGWLIAGDTHAGKSTTAALLASRRWAVGTDDTAFLVSGEPVVSVAAWREPIALRDGGLALLAQGGGVALGPRAKTGFTPPDLGGAWLDRTGIDIVALAALHDGPTSLDPLPRSAALAQLLSWSRLFVVDPGLAQQHLDLVARLVRQAACFRLLLGRDIFEHPDLLRELAP